MSETPGPVPEATSRPAPRRRTAALVPVAIAVLALFLRVWAPGPVTETVDERLWLIRSRVFDTAITHHDYDRATAWGAIPDLNIITMPGVTTMWAGTIGRHAALWGHDLGLNAAPGRSLDRSAPGLRWSRAVVALWCSVALGLLVWLAGRLVGRRAAAIAGVLLATEPWLAGHSDVLHTDAMVTMFSAVSVVAMAVAVRPVSPGPPWPRARRTVLDVDVFLLVLSALFGGLALLTKLNALGVLAPGLVVVAVADAWRRARTVQPLALQADERGAWSLARRLVVVGVAWAILAALVCVLLWPALWVSPFQQYDHLRASFTQIDTRHPQLFMGKVVASPGSQFYPVVLAYRLTPWFLLGIAATVVAAGARLVAWARRHRSGAGRPTVIPWAVLLAAVPYAAIITRQSNKLDRYGLPLLPFLALSVGVVVAWLVDRVTERAAPSRARAWAPLGVGVVLTALMSLATVSEAPYAISYVDPLAGGQRRAQHDILLGWGEGTSALGAVIAKREAGHCDRILVADPSQLRVSLPCGHVVGLRIDRLDDIDYAVIHIYLEQRDIKSDFNEAVRRRGTLVAETRIHGVAYEQLWAVN